MRDISRFTYGVKWTPEGKSYDEVVAILGRPLADAIFAADNPNDGLPNVETEYVVTAIDRARGVVTLARKK